MGFLHRSLINIAGNGSNTYSNVSGHFTATPVVGTKNIALVGVPFTLSAKNVAMGVIEKISLDGIITTLDLSSITVVNDIITLGVADALSNVSDFVTGDTVLVVLYGPDKPLDMALKNVTKTDTLSVAATAASMTITVVDYTKLHLTAATASGVITFGNPADNSTVSIAGLPTVADNKTFTKKTAVVEATAVASAPITFGAPANDQYVTVTTTEVNTFTKKTAIPAAAAVISGVITFGNPTDGSTVVFTGLPTDGTKTFTKVAADPAADQFATITDLTALIQGLTDLNASDDATDISITIVTTGAAMNSATVTGTDSFSALSLTFAAGGDAVVIGTDEFETADQLAALIGACPGLDAVNNAGEITVTVTTAGSAPNAWQINGTVGGCVVLFSTGADTYNLSALEFETIGQLTTLLNGLTDISATDDAADITLVAVTKGTSMNTVALTGTSSYSALSIGFSSGVNAAIVSVGGTAKTETTHWNATISNDSTATSLAGVINALASVNAVANGPIITVTAAAVGIGGDSITVTASDAVNLVLSHDTLNNSTYQFTGLLSMAPIFTAKGIFATPGSGAVAFNKAVFLNEVETEELVLASGDYFVDYRTGYFKVFTPNSQNENVSAVYIVKQIVTTV